MQRRFFKAEVEAPKLTSMPLLKPLNPSDLIPSDEPRDPDSDAHDDAMRAYAQTMRLYTETWLRK